MFELKIVSKCPVSEAIRLCRLSGRFTLRLSSPSLDKILAAMTIAAERNNKERFASIVEGLENHEAQQLQVWNHNIQLLCYFLNFNITTIKKKNMYDQIKVTFTA